MWDDGCFFPGIYTLTRCLLYSYDKLDKDEGKLQIQFWKEEDRVGIFLLLWVIRYEPEITCQALSLRSQSAELQQGGCWLWKTHLRTKGVSMRAKFMMSSVNDHIFPTIINTSTIHKCLERLRYAGDAESKCLDRRETKEWAREWAAY